MKSKILDKLKFDFLSDHDKGNIWDEIMEDNRSFAAKWGAVGIIYWCFCVFMSFHQEAFRLCREAYIAAAVLCVCVYISAKFPAKKERRLIPLTALLFEISFLGASLWIARNLLHHDISTILMFASPLIGPILFITDTPGNIVIALADILASLLLFRGYVADDLILRNVANLVIFASIGILLGHFINKTRIERYIYAESAAKLADLQTRYAYYDQLTGLQNRRAYEEKLETFRENLPPNCILIMLDLNGLKNMNDTLGHDAGDELIIGTAECLRNSFEGVETIYRLGGDEFAVTMNGTKDEVKKCLQQMEKISAEWNGEYVHGISVSHGFASSGEFADVDSLEKAADQRMYEHKNDYYETSGKEKRQ